MIKNRKKLSAGFSSSEDAEDRYWELFDDNVKEDGEDFLKKYYPKRAVYEWCNDEDMSKTFKSPSDLALALVDSYAYKGGKPFDLSTTYYTFDEELGCIVSIEDDDVDEYISDTILYDYKDEFASFCDLSGQMYATEHGLPYF